ncbi:helix-turn-helix domain-containing protein [Niallia circulans]|uniref:helix-turn-helix domain-containing protein n=1 Tax=Niallia circulans TaxID=1397 RepID=UPI0026EB1C53|nr:helix-turn-helix transcriptional regulator [Niallia circulans]
MKLINIGEVIKSKRKQLKIKQEELASLLGVTNTYISKVESGRVIPNIKRLQQLEKVLDVEFFAKDVRIFKKWNHVINTLEEKEITPSEVIELIDLIQKMNKSK